VNVSRLKNGVSQSKCPKCGGAVTLPSAPAKAPAQAAPEAPVSAQTRRLDPREIGSMLGAGDSSRSQPLPIAVEEVAERSDPDLGRLIEQKVDGLGDETSGKQKVLAAAPAAAVSASAPRMEPLPLPSRPAPPSLEPIALAREPVQAPERMERSAAGDPSRRISGSGSRSAAGGASRRISEPDTRLAPGPDSGIDAPASAAGAGPLTILIAGVVGGAIVSGALLLAGSALPSMLVPRPPGILISVLGDKLSLVIVTIALAGAAGLFGGAARPPAATEGEAAGARGVSVFRCAVAAGLLGLIAGVLTSLLQGGFDIVVTLVWTVSLALCGLVTAPIASLLSRR
jgi:hypothetical protein